MKQSFLNSILFNNLVSLGIYCATAIILERISRPLILLLGDMYDLAFAGVLAAVVIPVYIIGTLLLSRPTEKASILSILAPIAIVLMAMPMYFRFFPVYITLGHGLPESTFRSAQTAVYFAEFFNPALRLSAGLFPFREAHFAFQPLEIISVILSFVLPLLALLVGLKLRNSASVRFGTDSTIISHVITRRNRWLSNLASRGFERIEPLLGYSAGNPEKEGLPAWAIALIAIGIAGILLFCGLAAVDFIAEDIR